MELTTKQVEQIKRTIGQMLLYSLSAGDSCRRNINSYTEFGGDPERQVQNVVRFIQDRDTSIELASNKAIQDILYILSDDNT